MQDPHGWPPVASAGWWENLYAEREQRWSGNVNPVLADIAPSLNLGRVLDVGCGEGADVIWLAHHGWEATGIDVSPTATRRATAAAQEADLDPGRVRFVTGDLTSLPTQAYDLVSASFLHSPAGGSREEVLRQAAERVAPRCV